MSSFSIAFRALKCYDPSLQEVQRGMDQEGHQGLATAARGDGEAEGVEEPQRQPGALHEEPQREIQCREEDFTSEQRTKSKQTRIKIHLTFH